MSTSGDRIQTPLHAACVIVIGLALVAFGVRSQFEGQVVISRRAANSYVARGSLVTMYGTCLIVAGAALAVAGVLAMRRERARRSGSPGSERDHELARRSP